MRRRDTLSASSFCLRAGACPAREGGTSMDISDARVMVTGGGGFLGRRMTNSLEARGATPVVIRSPDYDLTQPEQTRAALKDSAVDYVVHAAAVVGGIGAN